MRISEARVLLLPAPNPARAALDERFRDQHEATRCSARSWWARTRRESSSCRRRCTAPRVCLWRWLMGAHI
jgi:hypothetical protein